MCTYNQSRQVFLKSQRFWKIGIICLRQQQGRKAIVGGIGGVCMDFKGR